MERGGGRHGEKRAIGNPFKLNCVEGNSSQMAIPYRQHLRAPNEEPAAFRAALHMGIATYQCWHLLIKARMSGAAGADCLLEFDYIIPVVRDGRLAPLCSAPHIPDMGGKPSSISRI